MDYEKDNLLSETIDNWRIGYAKKLLAFGVSEECRSALEKEFPELKESEDERIRNEIIAFIEQAIHSGGGTIIPEEKEDKWITYLERQKEHQNNSDGRNLDELAREYIDGVKQYHPTPTWDLMQTAVCYGYHLGEEVRSEDAESVKPTEWSEEDKVMLNSIIRIVHMKSISPLDEMDDRSKYEKYEDFLKSLPERFNLQPKQEWSEEDEKVYTFIYDFFENCWWNKTWDISRERTLKILKSLRPQPHWKPSEEQMDALDNARFCKSYDRSELDLLYEQLKKL